MDAMESAGKMTVPPGHPDAAFQIQLRRRCLERICEIRVQSALAEQFDAEAEELDFQSTQGNRAPIQRTVLQKKAEVQRQQAAWARDRVRQARIELECYVADPEAFRPKELQPKTE